MDKVKEIAGDTDWTYSLFESFNFVGNWMDMTVIVSEVIFY